MSVLECTTTLNESGNITSFVCDNGEVYSFLIIAILFVIFFYLAFIAFKDNG